MLSSLSNPHASIFPLIRHFSSRLTPILLKTFLTPNHVTFLSLLFGLICAGCFAKGTYNLAVIGAFLLVISYILDNCDGEIARTKNMSSEFGAKFDDMVDWLVDAFFFIALGYGVSITNDQSFWFWLGVISALGATIDYIIDLRYRANNKEKTHQKKKSKSTFEPKKPTSKVDWLIYIFHKLTRADFCFIVLILAILDVTFILLPLAAIGAQMYWIIDLFERARGYHI